eukprot:c1258_g1_i1.p1 GENE.c1258_g1_i1~~c1258_g1_i1.p1  ORF type:complete len:368 (+),score=61.93 c1258_g1_i1:134-1105(+)
MPVQDFIKNCRLSKGVLSTKSKLKTPYSILDWFHGTPPSTTELDKATATAILGTASSRPVYFFKSPKQAPYYCFLYPGTFNPNTLQYSWNEKGFEMGNFVAIYYAFYAYNRGKKIAGTVYGNHVGDWESVCVTFLNFSPVECHFKPHSYGTCSVAFTSNYEGVTASPTPAVIPRTDKDRKKSLKDPIPLPSSTVRFFNGHPIIFAGKGSHAMWPCNGAINYQAILYDNCGTACLNSAVWFTSENIEFIPPNIWLGCSLPPGQTFNWVTDIAQWGNPAMPSLLSQVVGALPGDKVRKAAKETAALANAPNGFKLRSPFKERFKK